MVKETKPEKQALLSKGSGKGSGEGRVDIQVSAGQVRPDAESTNKARKPILTERPGEGALLPLHTSRIYGQSSEETEGTAAQV